MQHLNLRVSKKYHSHLDALEGTHYQEALNFKEVVITLQILHKSKGIVYLNPLRANMGHNTTDLDEQFI